MEEKMSEQNRPESRFVERLEWQLSTEFRRANRLSSPSSKRVAVPRALVAVTLMAGILLTGVATIKAAEFIKDSWRKKIEIARAETEIILNKAHLESTREMELRAKQQFADGLIREEEYRVMKLAADKAVLALEESRLNLDEVKASGSIPSDRLHTPVKRGRDFVSERLKIREKRMELELEHLGRPLKRLQLLVEKGMVAGHELNQIQREIADREKILDELRKQLELRRRFVAGEISAREVEIKDRIAEAERKLHLVKSRVNALNTELKRVKDLEKKGLVSQTEAARLDYALSTSQAELKLAALELDILKKVK
jgi:hypothetical protein